MAFKSNGLSMLRRIGSQAGSQAGRQAGRQAAVKQAGRQAGRHPTLQHKRCLNITYAHAKDCDNQCVVNNEFTDGSAPRKCDRV